MTSSLSPFRFREFPRPSIFAGDPAFCGAKGTGKNAGKTQSQVATESVAKVTARTGRSPGSIPGLSDRADLLIEESNHKRGKARHG